MWGILMSIGLTLIKWATSDTAKAVLAVVIKDITDTGKEALPLIQSKVTEAMTHNDWTILQKADFVKEAVIAAFPGISLSLVNRLMENVYGALGGKA
jgi:hypothetical protein